MSARRDGPQPEILSVRTAARSRLFHIEAVKLRFANGNEREYERLAGSAAPGAVVIVPLLDTQNILLVREYAVGLERYELGLPMGLMHPGESALEAANCSGCTPLRWHQGSWAIAWTWCWQRTFIRTTFRATSPSSWSPYNGPSTAWMN